MAINATVYTDDQLLASHANIKRIHQTHLDTHGVKFHEFDTPRGIWLAILYSAYQEPVLKDSMSVVVKRYFPNASDDQQVRHLIRDGWDVECSRESNKGIYTLLNVYAPSATFTNRNQRRRGRLSAQNWDDLKRVYGHRCATCGAVDGEPDPRYGSTQVILQQGHQDPEGDSKDPENIIPQCKFCNEAYKNFFTFDDRGRAYAVGSVEPVVRARESVQLEIWEYLKNKFV